MKVQIAELPDGSSAPPFDRELLQIRAEQILKCLDRSDSELSISLIGDEAMRELNAQYRGQSKPTDVLSFSLLEGEHAAFRGQLMGEVVIALHVAAEQARQRDCSLDEELARLLIHGVLHLLGHDHEEEEEARVMRAEEQRLWQELQA